MLRKGLPELTTKRCVLRPVTMDDVTSLHELWTSPGVRRFLWDDEIITPSRTRAAIAQSEQLFNKQQGGLWGMWPSDAPTLNGFTGLWPFREPQELELLFGVAEHLWGRGYAPEIAQAVVAYAFDVLEMPMVRASTDAANSASMQVLQKLNFRLVRRGVVDGLDTVFYALAKAEVAPSRDPSSEPTEPPGV